MPTKPKRLENPGSFLVDSGLLFEINRTLLHPLGLALEVTIEDDGTSSISGVWDYRDDPEGMRFLDADMPKCAEKLQRFMDEFGKAKHMERLRRLGYVVQPDDDRNAAVLALVAAGVDGNGLAEKIQALIIDRDALGACVDRLRAEVAESERARAGLAARVRELETLVAMYARAGVQA